MHADPDEAPVEMCLREAETIALAYHRAARGDAWHALVAAVADALVDLAEAERCIARQGQLISHGYARGRTGASGTARLPRPEQA
jgi:3-methyladenine DNA glycosylase/8-oxoguanine DNA glycosylase